MLRLPPIPDGVDRVTATEQQVVQIVLQMPPNVTQPLHPFAHVPELVDDPWIGACLAVQDPVGRTWYARWLSLLSEYPQREVGVQVATDPRLSPEETPRLKESHHALRIVDWSEVLPLLLEVAEDPGDRDRRLVYADYLDDLGQPYAADSLRTLVANPALLFARWWFNPVAEVQRPEPDRVSLEQIRQDFPSVNA